jgi:hypothetical protein
MHSHDDLVPIDINMSLHEGHWLGENVIASTNEVYIEYKVVPHNAEHSLIVVLRCLRVELNDNSGL